MTWLPSVSGRTVELVHPVVEQVDFSEIAWSLAHTNRYGGHGFTQVSVGHHTLIGLDLVSEALRPWWLVHECHAARTGGVMQSARDAASAIEAEMFPGRNASIADAVWNEFQRRHDVMIHAAAGLPMPTPAQRAMIEAADVRCEATEHRDFHRPSERKWRFELEGVQPARGAIRRFMPPDKVADQLAARFYRYLPALRDDAL